MKVSVTKIKRLRSINRDGTPKSKMRKFSGRSSFPSKKHKQHYEIAIIV